MSYFQDWVQKSDEPPHEIAAGLFHHPLKEIVHVRDSAKGPIEGQAKERLAAALEEFEELFDVLQEAGLTQQKKGASGYHKMVLRNLHAYAENTALILERGAISSNDLLCMSPRLHAIASEPEKYPDPDVRPKTLRGEWQKHCIGAMLTGRKPSVYRFIREQWAPKK